MRLLVLLCFLLNYSASLGQNNTIFIHGSADGFDKGEAIQNLFVYNNELFLHGLGDGHDMGSALQAVVVSSNNIFQHGSGDGTDQNYYSQPTLIINNNLFLSGTGDGSDVGTFIQPMAVAGNEIFNHSNSDGFATSGFSQDLQVVNNNIFTHGQGDGTDLSEYRQPRLVIHNNIFNHGNGDGADASEFVQPDLVIHNNIFAHTNGDGHDFDSYTQPALHQNNAIFTHNTSDGFDAQGYTQSMLCNIPAAIHAININETEASILWVVNTNALRYQLMYKLKTGTSWTYTIVDNNQFNIIDLFPGTEYVFRIRSFCTDDNVMKSEWSDYFHFTTLGSSFCDAPTDVTAEATDHETLLNWRDDAVSYEVMYRLFSGGAWANFVVNDNQATISDLFSGTTYLFRIRAYCTSDGALKSDWSGNYYFNTTGATACPAPQFPMASELTETQALLSWTSVDEAVRYEVIHRTRAQGSWTYAITPSNDLIVDKLIPSQEYEFRTRAFCTEDNALKSDWSSYAYFMPSSTTSAKSLSLSTRVDNYQDKDLASRQLLIFPNPFAQLFQIELFMVEGVSSEITVYDSRGKILTTKKYEGAINDVIDLKDAPAGLYLIKIHTTGSQSFRRTMLKL